MEIFTIGFAGRNAGRFFGDLRDAGVARLVDVRLNNTSQLAGFTKHADLPFFLKEICGAEYIHEPLLTPTKDILDAYKKDGGEWSEYEKRFLGLMADRQIERQLDRALFDKPTVLLCSENTAKHCHRRLVLEYLKNFWGDVSIKHL
jgi:uncharacterized protein (DUF488 family)